MEKSRQKFRENQPNHPFVGAQTSLNVTREMQLMLAYIVIATDFEKEIVQIKKKFLAADFPSRFINSVCNDFLNKENNHDNIDFIILPGFFDMDLVILIEIPYCDKNEVASKQFIRKFNKFTNDKYDIRIKWLTRTMKTLFKLKD